MSTGVLQAPEWLCTSDSGALVLGQGGGARRSTALPLSLNARLGCVPHTLGRFDSAGESTYSRLQEAWASALIVRFILAPFDP